MPLPEPAFHSRISNNMATTSTNPFFSPALPRQVGIGNHTTPQHLSGHYAMRYREWYVVPDI